MKTLRIATRQSPLAMWQAEHIQSRLNTLYPDLEVILVPMVSKGDKILDVTLSKVGGKGLFTKELESSMLANESDIAVHSMKDVPMSFPEGLGLYVICQREEPTDAFVSNRYNHFDDLPQGAIVGTSSLRRQCQILAYRPDLKINFLRGNVGTRLSKLDNGDYDAIILASAGLIRLELGDRIKHALDVQMSLPAAGQGAVGIECRTDDVEIHQLLSVLNDPDTALRVSAERAMITELEGGCQVPIAGFATINGQTLSIKGRVGKEDGSQMIEVSEQLLLSNDYEKDLIAVKSLGKQIAIELKAKGADKILAMYKNA